MSNGDPVQVMKPVEELDQTYTNPAGKSVPPNVSIIMLPDGTFWDGGVSAGGNPVLSGVSLDAGVAGTILVENESRVGARLLNWSSSPVYISKVDPPAEGPPSDFIPPAYMDENGVIWPAQFEFLYSPTGEWFALCAETSVLGVQVW